MQGRGQSDPEGWGGGHAAARQAWGSTRYTCPRKPIDRVNVYLLAGLRASRLEESKQGSVKMHVLGEVFEFPGRRQ